MNFQEAVKLLEAGKKVRRRSAPDRWFFKRFCYSPENGYNGQEFVDQVGRPVRFGREPLQATDWEEYVEEKTLSDKIRKNNSIKKPTGSILKFPISFEIRDILLKEDVKEAVKKLLEQLGDTSYNLKSKETRDESERMADIFFKMIEDVFGEELTK